ncbi:TPA: DUF2857 family protein [Klebsiella oxytoca]|nr:DUF2857 family protein [Klebsiella oxytoca]
MIQHPGNSNFLLWELIDDIRQGLFSRCKSCGLTTEDIRLLTELQLDDVIYIARSSVSVVSYQVDPGLLRALIGQAREDRARKTLAERAVSLGASAKMMGFFFGWTGRDVARYRELNPDSLFSRGRPPIPDEQTARDVIQRLRQAGITAETEDFAMLEIMIDIAQQCKIPVCSVWHVIEETLEILATSPVTRAARSEACWARLSLFDFRDRDIPPLPPLTGPERRLTSPHADNNQESRQ